MKVMDRAADGREVQHLLMVGAGEELAELDEILRFLVVQDRNRARPRRDEVDWHPTLQDDVVAWRAERARVRGLSARFEKPPFNQIWLNTGVVVEDSKPASRSDPPKSREAALRIMHEQVERWAARSVRLQRVRLIRTLMAVVQQKAPEAYRERRVSLRDLVAKIPPEVERSLGVLFIDLVRGQEIELDLAITPQEAELMRGLVSRGQGAGEAGATEEIGGTRLTVVRVEGGEFVDLERIRSRAGRDS